MNDAERDMPSRESDPGETVTPRGMWAELSVFGLAFLAATSIGLGWALGSGSESSDWGKVADPRGQAALGVPSEGFRYWRATTVPPPAERFSAVRPPSPTGDLAGWPHEALAGLPDPNVLEPGFVPLRLEDVDAGAAPEHAIGDGPRLSIGGLDALGTRDLGRVLITRTVATELVVANVGSEDLMISRVYAGTRAIRTTIGGTMLDAAGYPARPIVVPAGARVPMEIALDGRRLLDHGTQAEHLQIFTNDRRHEAFDPTDAFSHETRLRLVFDGRELDALHRPISADEIPLQDGSPRLWLPELAMDGRGGDVIEIGADMAVGDVTVEVDIQNIGSGALVLAGAVGEGIAASVVPEIIEAGGRARLEITISPEERLDSGRWVRRQLTLETNDPLVPAIELSIIGSWSMSEDDTLDEGASDG